jgi:hypothetical protein
MRVWVRSPKFLKIYICVSLDYNFYHISKKKKKKKNWSHLLMLRDLLLKVSKILESLLIGSVHLDDFFYCFVEVYLLKVRRNEKEKTF